MIYIYLLTILLVSLFAIFTISSNFYKISKYKIIIFSIIMALLIFYLSIPIVKNYNKEVYFKKIITENCLKDNDQFFYTSQVGYLGINTKEFNGSTQKYDYIIRDNKKYNINDIYHICKNIELENKIKMKFKEIDDLTIFK